MSSSRESTIIRFMRWIEATYPSARRPSTSDAVLAGFEEALAVQLPDGLRSLYAWSDGLQGDPPLIEGYSLMISSEVLETRAMLAGMMEAGEWDDRYVDWWRPAWIPFLEDGSGDHYCLDPVGDDGGGPGQIVLWRHDAVERDRLAPSFDTWLAVYLDGLDGGVVTASDCGLEAGDDFEAFVGRRHPGFPSSFSAKKAKPKPPKRSRNPLADKLLACFRDRMSPDDVRAAVAGGALLDARDDEGMSPLHHAVKGSNTALVEMLLDLGAVIDSVDAAGNTALQYAAQVNKRFVGKRIDLLIARGADRDHPNHRGQTPLFWATSPEAVVALVRAGADLSHRDYEGKTAAEYTILPDVRRALVEAGAGQT